MRIHYLLPMLLLFFSACKKDTATPAKKLPVLSTTIASQLSTTSVKTGGNITDEGTGTISSRGVCWGTATSPTIAGNHTTDGTGPGSFESNITGLLPATTYYLRAYASSQEGTAYGTEISFTTLSADVYVSGGDGTGVTAFCAVIWKNGVQTRLTNGNTEAQALAVYVSGNDVYAAGYEKNATGAVPKVWKNGAATALSSVPESYAYNVFVSGSDVYVAGETNGPPAVTAAAWKNGEPLTMDGGTDGSSTLGLFVNGNDVYVCGNKFTGPGNYLPVIWKNGVVSYLSTIKGVAQSVYVYNNDVYVLGYEIMGGARIGRIWKNGVASRLTSSSNMSYGGQIIVVNGDVYVSFTEYVNGKGIIKYLKNGVETALTDGNYSAAAGGIAVLGNDVYVCGNESNGIRTVAKFWKNGVVTTLTDGSAFAGANSIFVK